MKSLNILFNMLKVNFFFSKKELKIFRLNIFLNILVSVLEFFGLSIIIALILSLFDTEKFLTILSQINFLSNFDQKLLLFIFFFLIFFKYVLQTIFYFFLYQNNKKIQLSFTNRLLNNFFLSNEQSNINSQKLNFSNIVFNEIPLIFSSFHRPLIDLISEIFLLIFIVIFLLYHYGYELILFFFFILVLLFFLITLSAMINNRLGYKRLKNTATLYSNLKSIILNRDLIKILFKETYFSNLSLNFLNKIIDAEKLNNFFQRFSRILFEFCVIFSIFFMIIYFKFYSTQNLILDPNIIILLIPILRLAPSISRINTHFNKIHFVIPSINKIRVYLNSLKNIKSDNEKNIQYLDFKNNINIKNINIKIEKRYLIKNLYFDIKKNSKTLIIGPSGSGKSSLINFLLGIKQFNTARGKILIDNKKISNSERKWKSLFSYVPQDTVLINSTILENVAFGVDKDNINIVKVKLILKQLKLDSFIKNMNNKEKFCIKDNGENISGGERQRLGIARALYFDRPILILDEPTASLDKINSLNIIKSIMQINKTVLVISHDLTIKNQFKNILELQKN